ncbi:hypothetical protein F53441_8465 [Fusarium austroafricanum]|uniref:Uncharacterized protein n=1 Tax=Fusarium austroafricanum TaxID=2364996 RepID=A0A8H4KEE7_9HYPO|nr:hypothetical protein F53441_8465 [Fusarium austroafricanum]
MSLPQVPSPYNKLPTHTQELLAKFHQNIGKWPWELTSRFMPLKWGQNMIMAFQRLLTSDLPGTPGATEDRLIAFMEEASAKHPNATYRSKLSLHVIAKATKWLADQREVSLMQQRDSDSGSESDSSIRNEPLPFHCMKTRKTVALELISDKHNQKKKTKKKPTRTQPVRTARKRPMGNYNVRELLNVDDSEEDEEQPGQLDQARPEHTHPQSAEPPAKKRLMLFIKFSPHNANQLPKADGHSISGPGERIPHASNNGISYGNSSLPTVTLSLNDAQAAYAAHLTSEIAKADETITRLLNNLTNSTRRQQELVESIRLNTEAKEIVVQETTEAFQALQRARALCEADIETMETLRRISMEKPGLIPTETMLHIEDNAQTAKREAEEALDAKKKRLTDLANKIQMDESQVGPLGPKIEDLSGKIQEAKEGRRRLDILHRFIVMGSKLVDSVDEVLRETNVEEWTEKNLQEMQQIENGQM